MLAIFLAQEAGNGSPLGIFTNYVDLGFVVIVLALLFSGKLRRESEVAEKQKEIDDLKATVKQYIEHYEKDVLPALIDVTKLSGEIVAFLNKRRN